MTRLGTASVVRWLLVPCAIAFLGAFVVPSAQASTWDLSTYVTFGVPVQLAGKTLPAGTYLFTLVDSASTRNIVQVTDRRGSRVFGTFLVVPTLRADPAKRAIISLEERKGQPEVVTAWFYPGERNGLQFIQRSRPVRDRARG